MASATTPVQVELKIADYGRDPADGERVMDVFMDVFPEGGPSVLQDTKNGILTVTITISAADPEEAVHRATDIFKAAIAQIGLGDLPGRMSLQVADDYDLMHEYELKA